MLGGGHWFESKICDVGRCQCVRGGDKTRGATACAEEEEDGTNPCCRIDRSAEACADEEEDGTKPCCRIDRSAEACADEEEDTTNP